MRVSETTFFDRKSQNCKVLNENGKNGYKLHTLTHNLIRRIETTKANVHDSQVDLSEKGEVVYRDRVYQGAKCKGYSATMKKREGIPLAYEIN